MFQVERRDFPLLSKAQARLERRSGRRRNGEGDVSWRSRSGVQSFRGFRIGDAVTMVNPNTALWLKKRQGQLGRLRSCC